jgi:anthranilate synthase component II
MQKHILIIDNYDSFTYNLVHILEQYPNTIVKVVRNRDVDEAEAGKFDKIVISPGPGIPEEAGNTIPIIQQFFQTKPILGVCLGHQAIAVAFGGRLKNLPVVLHGKALETRVIDKSEILFSEMPQRFMAGRYHSWVIEKKYLAKSFQITAIDNKGEIMAIRHKVYPLHGIQFHPESVLTEYGKQLLFNWLEKC